MSNITNAAPEADRFPESVARHVVTLNVSRGRSGRVYIDTPQIAGLLVSGEDIDEALGKVGESIAALDDAGCPQARAVRARANAPILTVQEREALAVIESPKQPLHVVVGDNGAMGFAGALASPTIERAAALGQSPTRAFISGQDPGDEDRPALAGKVEGAA